VPIGFESDPPIVLALLTCDSVSVGLPPVPRVSIVGLYDRIMVPSLPAAHLLTVFISLMDVHEKFTLSTRLVPPGSLGVGSPGFLVGESEVGPGEAGDPVQAVSTGNVLFSVGGRYEVQVYGNGAYLAHKPLLVFQQPPHPGTEA
jgi:hypothetical protein